MVRLASRQSPVAKNSPSITTLLHSFQTVFKWQESRQSQVAKNNQKDKILNIDKHIYFNHSFEREKHIHFMIF